MAVIRIALPVKYGTLGASLFRFIIIGSLFIYSAITLTHLATVWRSQRGGELTGESLPVRTDASSTPLNVDSRTFRAPNAKVTRKPARRRDAYRALQTRIKRREAELNHARTKYLHVRHEVALGKATEQAAMKARARVEAALTALQAERDRLVSSPS